MDSLLIKWDAWLLSLTLLVALAAAWGVGWMIGRRRPQDAQDPAASRVADASLALMGLLLAFTFAMAISKHDHRRETVVADSNSIGDFYTCVCLLTDPAVREPLRRITRDYASERLELAKGPPNADLEEQALKRWADTHNRMTELVARAVNGGGGTPVTVPLVNTLNNLTSSHASRLMASRDRLPASIVGLLSLATVVSIALLGWQQGAAGKARWVSTMGFVLLIGAAFYTTVDLNQPRRGLIRVSQEPLERLLASMGDDGGGGGGGK